MGACNTSQGQPCLKTHFGRRSWPQHHRHHCCVQRPGGGAVWCCARRWSRRCSARPSQSWRCPSAGCCPPAPAPSGTTAPPSQLHMCDLPAAGLACLILARLVIELKQHVKFRTQRTALVLGWPRSLIHCLHLSCLQQRLLLHCLHAISRTFASMLHNSDVCLLSGAVGCAGGPGGGAPNGVRGGHRLCVIPVAAWQRKAAAHLLGAAVAAQLRYSQPGELRPQQVMRHLLLPAASPFVSTLRPDVGSGSEMRSAHGCDHASPVIESSTDAGAIMA